MSDIFQEVDEDVRRDKATELWAKYQNFVYAAIALIVLGTAGYRFYDYQRTTAAEAAGAQFQAALKLSIEGKSDEAIAAFQKLEGEGGAGYRAIVRLTVAVGNAEEGPESGRRSF